MLYVFTAIFFGELECACEKLSVKCSLESNKDWCLYKIDISLSSPELSSHFENILSIISFQCDKIFEVYFLDRRFDNCVRRSIVLEMFNGIDAERYSCLADTRKNMELYKIFFGKINLFFEQEQGNINVLDFGCGTGISYGCLEKNSRLNLMGYDFSETSCILNKIKVDELLGQYRGFFDAIIFSYVLHYDSLSDEDYFYIYQGLKSGAVLFGNVHKNLNLEKIINKLNKTGLIRIDGDVGDYGTILSFMKEET